jgi:hypothetical protein
MPFREDHSHRRFVESHGRVVRQADMAARACRPQPLFVRNCRFLLTVRKDLVIGDYRQPGFRQPPGAPLP